MQPERLLDAIWRSLQDATERRTPFTLGRLGTTGLDGVPQVRSVILRRFDRERRRILFATNAHSAKVAEIRRDPRVALTVDDDSRGVQLRMTGTAEAIADAAERARAWETFGPHSRALYRSPLVPGSPLPAGRSADGVDRAEDAGPDPEDDAAAFERFAWVGIELERLDWLNLAEPQHERWWFTRQGEDWAAQPVVP